MHFEFYKDGNVSAEDSDGSDIEKSCIYYLGGKIIAVLCVTIIKI